MFASSYIPKWILESVCLFALKLSKQLKENQYKSAIFTVFENYRKSLIQHCERSELRLHFEWTKVNSKRQKWSILASFWKPEVCGQTVLPDRSVLIGQKLVENAKIKKNQMRHFE